MAAPITPAVRAACSLGPLILASGLLMTVGAAPSNAQDSSIRFNYLGPATNPTRQGEVLLRGNRTGNSGVRRTGQFFYAPTSRSPRLAAPAQAPVIQGDFFSGIGGIRFSTTSNNDGPNFTYNRNTGGNNGGPIDIALSSFSFIPAGTSAICYICGVTFPSVSSITGMLDVDIVPGSGGATRFTATANQYEFAYNLPALPPDQACGPEKASPLLEDQCNGQFSGHTLILQFNASALVNNDGGVWFGDGSIAFSVKPNASQVPGPLPILGASAAFAFSRKLRRRIKATA
jgi:hypothetical protein